MEKEAAHVFMMAYISRSQNLMEVRDTCILCEIIRSRYREITKLNGQRFHRQQDEEQNSGSRCPGHRTTLFALTHMNFSIYTKKKNQNQPLNGLIL